MKKITYGSRQLNKLLDDTLMTKYCFPSETLMEIAGLAIAQLTHSILTKNKTKNKGNKVCVLAGPGNNGGDGLVAARHLKMMDFSVQLIVFKKLEGKNGIYQSLCELNGIQSKNASTDFGEPETAEAQKLFSKYLEESDLIIDGVFGFPFTGDIRAPYKYFLPSLRQFENKILSVDIPSGWDANLGNIHNLFTPHYLISLGIPKQCSEKYGGEHYLGGRFIPKSVAQELDILLPEYEGTSLYIRL